MTITAPNSFRRSSERKVSDPHEQLVAERERRNQQELQAFEEIGLTRSAVSVLVSSARDESRYDLEGRVW